MKKIGLKNIAITLTVATAAVAAPFVWEWAKPLFQSPPAIIASPDPDVMDEPSFLPPDPDFLPADPDSLSTDLGSPAIAEEPVVAPAVKTIKKIGPVPAAPPVAFGPAVPATASNTDEKAEEQDKIIPKEIKSEQEPILSPEKTEITSEVPRPQAAETKESAGEPTLVGTKDIKSGNIPSVLPPLAVVKADAPEMLDPAGSKIIRTAIRFINHSGNDFAGNLEVKTPRGIRSVSGEAIGVQIGGGDTLFVPVVFMTGAQVPAGENEIEYTLKDTYNREVEKGFSRLPVTEKVSLQLTLDQQLLMITNLSDSLSLNARVHNRGNTDQLVTVVMAYPANRGGKAFRELQGWVSAGKDTLFTLKVWPREILLNENITWVNISGLYGPEKEVFGNANLALQGVASSGRFTDNDPTGFLLYDNQYIPQDLTLSYRRLGRSTMYQVMGGGHVDLPVGSLSLQGLVYKTEGQEELMALNTLMTYRYNNHSVTVGNINEQMEFSTFGRGIKAVVSDKNSKNTLKVGLVDNQFNLFSSRSLFENGYTFFVKDHIGAERNIGLNYMLRDDQWEQARHHITGGEWKWEKDKTWNFLLRSHGGLSDYRNREKLVPSGSAEFQYSGQVNNNTLSGNFYYSTAYFPGNRRGMVNLQQNFNRQLKSGSAIRANAFYSNFSPRSYHFDMDLENTNFRGEGVYSFPTKGRTGVGLGYQQQTETGNLSYLGNSDLVKNRAITHSHRLVEYLSWRAGKHNIYAGLENGVVKNFHSSDWKPQGRANIFYNFGRLSLNSTYQYGGYFLSEQNFSEMLGKVTQRLLFNASWTKEFLNDNLMLNTGANYSKDFVIGNTYSASANSRYRINRQYSLFLNSVVYNYAFHNTAAISSSNRTLYNVEGGITLNLNQPAPATGKKSKLNVLVFQDKNGNNVRDADEAVATDYMIVLQDKVFLTDEKGQINYSGLPWGTYTVKAGAQAGWFHNETTFVVGGFREKVEIPLKQAGSVRGTITYRYDERTAKEFVPRLAGITLKVTRNGEGIPVQRVITDNDGHFLAFLPNGQYIMELESSGLDDNATVMNPTQAFSIESGRIFTLEPFVIQVQSKKINIRQFVQASP